MEHSTRKKWLKLALVIIGLIFIFGIFPLMMLWPSGWRWIPNQSEYEQMILGIYATLGVFLLLASKNPQANRSLIWFTVWSSVVHAGIMAYQAYVSPLERTHLYGDVLALFFVAIILSLLMPRQQQN